MVWPLPQGITDVDGRAKTGNAGEARGVLGELATGAQGPQEFWKIRKFFKDHDTDVTLISDQHGRAGDAYGVKGIPHMIIVGRDGNIAAIHVGYSEQLIPFLIVEINSTWNKTTPDSQSPN